MQSTKPESRVALRHFPELTRVSGNGSSRGSRPELPLRVRRVAVHWSSYPAKIAYFLLFATAAVAPLPFGSNQSALIALWCVILGVALVLMPIRGLAAGQLALIGLGLFVVAAYALVIHEQLADHPWLSLAVPHPIWRQAQEALGTPLTPVVAIARNQPWFELGRPLVCVLAIACGFLAGVDEVRARQLLRVVSWSGAVYAAYGISSFLFDPGHVLWLEKTAYLEAVTGTFINRNTAGAYFGSCAVLWSLFFWEAVRRQLPAGPIKWGVVSIRLHGAKGGWFSLLMFFLCLVALFMTRSRGAIVVSLVALILTFTIFFRRHLPQRSGVAAAIAASGVIALLLLQFLGGGVNARFDAQGLADEGRLAVYKSTLRMIGDHPWFGTGEGTFAYAFPAYRDASVPMWGVWDMAHNTLLQIAADMGLPIAGLVVVAWGVIFGTLVHGVRVRRRGIMAPLAALGVATIAVLHSFVDFSLQIPGYAIVALSIVGAGLGQSFARSGGDQSSGRAVKRNS
jgi:O-antigen ligase